MEKPYLVDGGQVDDPLAGFSEARLGLGRHQEIDDETLRRILVGYNSILEQNWGLIGWELKRAKTSTDIRNTFNLITSFEFPLLDRFRHEATLESTTEELRELRGDLAAAQTQGRKAYEKREEARLDCERAFSAITFGQNEEKHATIQRLRLDIAKESERANAAFEARQKRTAALIDELDQREAHFARHPRLVERNAALREEEPIAQQQAQTPATHRLHH